MFSAKAADQDHPDFSGNWKLKAADSDIRDLKLPAEFSTLAISQNDGSITIGVRRTTRRMLNSRKGMRDEDVESVILV
jgi:hypothetical protein